MKKDTTLDVGIARAAAERMLEQMEDLRLQIQKLGDMAQTLSKGREMALVRTKLQEAGFWAREASEGLERELSVLRADTSGVPGG